MLVTRTPAGKPVGHQPAPQDQRAPALTQLGTSGLSAETDEAFLSRFGDVIDDRIAEILDELLDERNIRRPPRRLPHILATIIITLALAVSVLLRHSPLAAWIIWPSAATTCLAIICATRARKS